MEEDDSVDTILMIIAILLITTIGGIIRLCVFSSFTIKEALPIILICDIVIGGVFLFFKLFHFENKGLIKIISISLLLPVIIYFTYKSTKRELKEEQDEKEQDERYKD